jgi:TM2 domain-containing membrane protein YozV
MGFTPPPGHGPLGFPPNALPPPWPPAPPPVAPPPRVYSDKQRSTAFLLSYFLGFAGGDRFYLGQWGLAIGKLLTFGGCGIWWIVDVILFALDVPKDRDGLPLRPPAMFGEPRVRGNDVLVASVFAGNFGIDRFLLDQPALGIAKLVTAGGCGIWQLVDIVLAATGSIKDARGNSLKWD